MLQLAYFMYDHRNYSFLRIENSNYLGNATILIKCIFIFKLKKNKRTTWENVERIYDLDFAINQF